MVYMLLTIIYHSHCNIESSYSLHPDRLNVHISAYVLQTNLTSVQLHRDQSTNNKINLICRKVNEMY